MLDTLTAPPLKPLLLRFELTASLALLAFAIGHAVATFASDPLPLWGWLSVIGITVSLLLLSKRPWVMRGALLCLCLSLGVSHALLRQPADVVTQPLIRWHWQTVTMAGQLTAKERAWQLQATQLNGNLLKHPITVRLKQLPASESLALGQEVTVKGRLRLPNKAPYPGGFDEQHYLTGLGVQATLNHTQIVSMTEPDQLAWHWQGLRWVEQARDRIDTVFRSVLGSQQGPLLASIVLGERAIPVDPLIKQQFIQTGLIHLLAASGMNVGIVAALLLGLGRLCRLPRWLLFSVAMVGVAGYALLAGLPPSIQRAGLMLEIALLLKLVNRHLPPFLLLMLALAVLLLLAPHSIHSLGLQLSVLTTLGIILLASPGIQVFNRRLTTLPHWLRWPLTILGSSLIVTMAAQLWAWPLILFYFNRLPLLSPLLNTLAALVVPFCTALGFSAAFLLWLWQPLAEALLWLSQPFNDLLLVLAEQGASLDWTVLTIPSPPPWSVVGCYLLLLISGLACSPKLKWSLKQHRQWLAVSLVVTVLPILWSLWGQPEYPQLQRVLVSDDKQVLLLRPNVSTLLAWVPSPLSNWQQGQLASALRHQGMTHLTAWIEATRTDNTTLSMPQGVSATSTYRLLPDHQLTASGLTLRREGRGALLNWHGLRLLTARQIKYLPQDLSAHAALVQGHWLALDGQLPSSIPPYDWVAIGHVN